MGHALLLTASLSACHSVTAPPQGARSGVLFIGNSLTYTNDLPRVVAEIARADGRSLGVASLARPDRALIDYVADGSAASAVRGGQWTHVVMQQGPSTLPICRDTLVLGVQRIDAVAREIGASSVVMMSWPSTARAGDVTRVWESALMAARHVGARFAPAGDAWYAALALDPQLPLYGGDGYHPAPLGTWLAALVVYEQLTGRDVRALPPSAATLGIGGLSANAVQQLLRIAHEANERAAAATSPAWAPSAPPVPAIRC